MSRYSDLNLRSGDVDFNPIGENLAMNFLQTRNPDRRASSDSNVASNKPERDVWADGGEHLSTNKLSLMLSDMQVIRGYEKISLFAGLRK